MTTIVVTSEEDPALSVVRFTSVLAWADAGPEVAEPQVARECIEAQECMLSLRWLDLASLMLTSADLVVPRVSDRDLECIYTVICNLVTRAGTPDETLEMAKLISAKVAQQPNDRPALRLKMFFVYTKALDLAVNGKFIESIISSFKKLDSLLKEWNVGKMEQRELFLTISNILKDNKRMAKDSLAFLSKYLATFSSEYEESYVTNETKEEAVQAIIEFVKSPGMFQCDLLDLPAVRQLENDEKYATVYHLLKIFLTQRLDAYSAFRAANSTSLKSYGLVHEDCITKMRLITLVDLSTNDSGEIPYSAIMEALQIAEDEVEHWVVKAITSKLLDCKMNQMSQTVIVSRHADRVFGPAQWQALRLKHGVWRANIANAISTIQANKATEEGIAAAQGERAR